MTLRGWKEKQATVAVRPADPLPAAVDAELAADRAGRVLHDGQPVPLGDRQDRRHVAGQAHLVDRHDGPGPRRDRRLHERRVHVVGPRVDVHEHRPRPAVAAPRWPWR